MKQMGITFFILLVLVVVVVVVVAATAPAQQDTPTDDMVTIATTTTRTTAQQEQTDDFITSNNNQPSQQFMSGIRDNLMNLMTLSFQTNFHHHRSLAAGNNQNAGCYLAEDNKTRICRGNDNLGGMNVVYGSSCPVTAKGLSDCSCQITAHNNQSCQKCSFCDNSGSFSLDCRNVLISDYSCAGVDCYDNCLGRGYGNFDPSIVFNNTATTTTTPTSGTSSNVPTRIMSSLLLRLGHFRYGGGKMMIMFSSTSLVVVVVVTTTTTMGFVF